MIDLKDKQNRPDLEKIGDYVQNPVFMRFCNEVKELYKCVEQIEYSSCSLEKGWNVKFKSAGGNAPGIYPRNSGYLPQHKGRRRPKVAYDRSGGRKRGISGYFPFAEDSKKAL